MKKPIIIWMLILLLLILFSEGIIRIHYGSPPYEPDPPEFRIQYVRIHKKFFKKVRKGNKYVYVPQKQAVKAFQAVKASSTVRIFILGGSVAGAFSRFPFEHILDELIPDKDFEVINYGIDGYDSYRVYLAEKEILSYQADLIIVLSGNNEYYNKVKINVRAYYINKFLRKSWIYRKLQDRFLQWCVERGLMHSGRDRKKRLIDYARNIRRIVRKAEAKGVPIILCTLPVNFRDCPPPGNRPVNKKFLLGHFLLENGDYSNAVDEFKNYLEDDPDNPSGFYFLGRAYEGIKNHAKAKKSYLKALELEEWHRAKPSSNEIIRRTCGEEGIGLADLERAFMNIAPYGLLGREQFYDNCHYWPEYYALVAEVIIREISQNRTRYSSIFGSDKYKLDSFSLSHDFLSLKERGRNSDDVIHECKVAVWRVIELERNRLFEPAISYFETVYSMNSKALWNIQFEKDEFKETFLNEFSTREFITNFNFKKHWPRVLCHIGETYRRLKLYKEALTYFNEAIALDENSYLPYLGRALTYHALGDRQKTKSNIEKAEELSKNLEVKYYKEILGF